MSISLALPTYIFLCSITWENLTLNRIALCMNPIESIIIHIIERKVKPDLNNFYLKYLFRRQRPSWRKRSIPTHSGWLYPLTFDAEKGLKEA